MCSMNDRLWKNEADDLNGSNHFIEQYKIYVELADRISQRRAISNTFFLTFNTTLVAALSGFYKSVPQNILVAMYLAALTIAISWMLLLRSYRNLNTAKFKVIGRLEERLPARIFYEAEWNELGRGKDYSKYIPLSLIETVIPVIYLLIYVYLFFQALNVA